MKTLIARQSPGKPRRVVAALCAAFTSGLGLLMITSAISAAQTDPGNTAGSENGMTAGVVLQQRSRWIQPPALDARFNSPRSPDRRNDTASSQPVDADGAADRLALQDSLAAAAVSPSPKRQVDIVEAGYKPVAETDADVITTLVEGDQNPGISGEARIRVVLHSNSTAGDIHRLFAETLEASDQLELEQREVDFVITRHQVRFFHAGDLLTGRAVTDALIEKLRERQGRNAERIILKDFTHYTPGPEAGTLEVWVH